MHKPKGSTVIIVFMYVTWVLYILLSIWCKQYTEEFLPAEVTYGTAALFIVETVSLARLKMTKEGTTVTPRHTNTFLESMGLGTSEFEDEIERIQQDGEQEPEPDDCDPGEQADKS